MKNKTGKIKSISSAITFCSSGSMEEDAETKKWLEDTEKRNYRIYGTPPRGVVAASSIGRHTNFNTANYRRGLAGIRDTYNIRVGTKPDKASAKRVGTLNEELYFVNGGNIHDCQGICYELMKACKKAKLICDPMEMEYRGEAFKNYLVPSKNTLGNGADMAEQIIRILIGGKPNGVRCDDGEGCNGTTPDKQKHFNTAKRRRITSRKVKSKSLRLSR